MISDAAARCHTCGAWWGDGRYTSGCNECGGGAMERACPWCQGRCGEIWRRAVTDSNEAHEARWLGACRYRIWVDEAALPTRLRAEFRPTPLPTVIDSDKAEYYFGSTEEAFRWLAQEGYVPEQEIFK